MSAAAAALPRASLIPPSLKPLAMLIGIAAAVAAGVGIVLWSKEPTYALLYGNLGQQDAAQIAQALDSNGVPYKLDAATGAITFDKLEPGWRVTRSALTVRGRVPGVSEEDFQAAAEQAKTGCPISNALNPSIELTVEATLEG